jgi:hypothetical protein
VHKQAAEADALLASFKPSPGGAAAAGTGAGAAAAAVEAARPALLRAQLALDEGNVASALELLSAGLPAELASRPAVVATRVALLEQVRRVTSPWTPHVSLTVSAVCVAWHCWRASACGTATQAPDKRHTPRTRRRVTWRALRQRCRRR